MAVPANIRNIPSIASLVGVDFIAYRRYAVTRSITTTIATSEIGVLDVAGYDVVDELDAPEFLAVVDVDAPVVFAAGAVVVVVAVVDVVEFVEPLCAAEPVALPMDRDTIVLLFEGSSPVACRIAV